MLAAAGGGGSDDEDGGGSNKNRAKELRQRLHRLQKQLKDLNRDIIAIGDDPFRMGSAFLEPGDAESDDEYLA